MPPVDSDRFFTTLTDIVSKVLILQDMVKKLRNSKEKPLVCQKESPGKVRSLKLHVLKCCLRKGDTVQERVMSSDMVS